MVKLIEDVLLEPFSIEQEPHCYTIHEKKLTERKDGTIKESKSAVAFPRRIEHALGWVVREKTRRRMPGAASLKEYVTLLKEGLHDVQSILDHV